MNILRGVDISHWNSDKDFDFVKDYADFFILKATEGRSYIDPTYKARFTRLMKLSKCVASYHFYNKKYSVGEQFVNITKNIDGFNFPYVLDVEETGTDWREVFELANRLTNFYGRKPIIYTGYAMYNKIQGVDRKAYNWWIARYNNKIKDTDIIKDNVVMWQYSDKSNWCGKNLEIDGDIFHGTYQEFMDLGKVK